MPILKENGAWIYKGRGNEQWQSDYRDALLKYFNCLDPLFEKAKRECEFEFICSLLRVKGIDDVGWDSWENTVSFFDSLKNIRGKNKGKEISLQLSLFLYAHIIEASEPYELLANLINIVNGGRYNSDNFPDIQRNGRPFTQSPFKK